MKNIQFFEKDGLIAFNTKVGNGLIMLGNDYKVREDRVKPGGNADPNRVVRLDGFRTSDNKVRLVGLSVGGKGRRSSTTWSSLQSFLGRYEIIDKTKAWHLDEPQQAGLKFAPIQREPDVGLQILEQLKKLNELLLEAKPG